MKEKPNKIISNKNLVLHFKEAVDKELKKFGLSISEATSFYIVNLLASYFKTEKLIIEGEKGLEEITLAELLKKALEADVAKKLELLKKMGDHSLYVSGYFAGYLDSKIVDIDYYINMGEGAYDQLATLYKDKGDKEFSKIYSELVEHFIRIVEMLSSISNESNTKSNQDILKLYKRWLNTKSKKVEEKLKEEGILPKKDPSSDN